MMNLVWTRSVHKGSELLLLLAIADNANDDGFAFPGIELLARKTRLTPRGVQYALRKLLDASEPEVEQVKKGSRGRASEYQIRTQTFRHRPDALARGSYEADGTNHTKPTSPQPSVEPSEGESANALSREKAKKKRAADPLYEAVAVACGLRLDAMTREAARLCGIAASEIRKAGGVPETIQAAVSNYHRLFEGAAITPKALANHWPAVAPRTAAARSVCAECGVGGGLHIADCPNAKREADE